MIWSREHYLDWMTFGGQWKRPMFCELFGPLIGLDEEWRAQGATEDEINMTAFDWDYVPTIGCGGHAGPKRLPTVTLSEDDENLIQRDYLGRTVQLCKKTATIALPLDFPVKTMDDWLAIKPRFVFTDDRIDWQHVEKARAAQADGAMVVSGIPGAFDMIRELMGEENGCLAYYDQPELVEDVLQTIGDTCVAVYERLTEKLTIDQLSVHEDFAGRSGPLAGPSQIGRFFEPYYRRVWDLLRSRGTRIFEQDTDGNVNSVIVPLLDAGLTAMHPMEPAAGMDIVQLRAKYGRKLAMKGGIDKHVLRQGRDAIRRELEYKMQPMMREGGMVFGLDHRIPNGTPLADYRYYVDLGREILGLPPRQPDARGWRRMAF
jgi:hypothetical protein